jgi:hypothetical protein
MTIEELFEKYKEEFNAIEYGKYDIEYLQNSNYVNLKKLDGWKYLYDRIKEKIPPLTNREEIALELVEEYMRGSSKGKKSIANKIDIEMTLLENEDIHKLKSEYLINQTIPNLEDMIRKIVREELNSKK